MINGIKPSQYPALRLTHMNHHRKLTEISTQQHSNFSWWGDELKMAIIRRKNNHGHWKAFMRKKTIKEIERGNQTYISKLRHIHTTPSQYTSPPLSPTPAMIPANFYHRKRREEIIEHQNPEIARRIINVSCTLSQEKDQAQFRKTRMIMERMEKFKGILRMTQRQGKWRTKTEKKQHNLHSNQEEQLSQSCKRTDYKTEMQRRRDLKFNAISSKLVSKELSFSPIQKRYYKIEQSTS